MEILSIVGIGLLAAAIAVLLRQYRPEYAMLVSLAAGIFILYGLLENGVVPVLEEVRSILDSTAMPGEYAAVLFKSLGICFLTQVACDTCRDAGESAISAKVEMAGKLAVLAVSLPLFRQVLSIVGALIA